MTSESDLGFRPLNFIVSCNTRSETQASIFVAMLLVTSCLGKTVGTAIILQARDTSVKN